MHKMNITSKETDLFFATWPSVAIFDHGDLKTEVVMASSASDVTEIIKFSMHASALRHFSITGDVLRSDVVFA